MCTEPIQTLLLSLLVKQCSIAYAYIVFTQEDIRKSYNFFNKEIGHPVILLSL